MARAYVGEFSLTPSPQSNGLYAECAWNTEFFYFFTLSLALSLPFVYPYILASFHHRRIHSRNARAQASFYLYLSLSFRLYRSPYTASFSQFLRNWSAARATREFDCLWKATRHPLQGTIASRHSSYSNNKPLYSPIGSSLSRMFSFSGLRLRLAFIANFNEARFS